MYKNKYLFEAVHVPLRVKSYLKEGEEKMLKDIVIMHFLRRRQKQRQPLNTSQHLDRSQEHEYPSYQVSVICFSILRGTTGSYRRKPIVEY